MDGSTLIRFADWFPRLSSTLIFCFVLLAGCGSGSPAWSVPSGGGSSGGSGGPNYVNYSFTGLVPGAGNMVPVSIAIDASGNAWVGNGGSTYASNLFLFEIQPGAATDCSTGCNYFATSASIINTQAETLAIDMSGNVWMGSVDLFDGTNVIEVKANAAADCSSGCAGFKTTSTGSTQKGIAVDGAGNIWTDGAVPGVYELSNTGVQIGAFIDSVNYGLSSTSGIAIDGNNNVWVPNPVTNAVMEISPSAAADCSSGCTEYTGGGISVPDGVAIDAVGNVWISNSGNNSVTEITTGAANDCSTGCNSYTTGALDNPAGIAVDGGGNIWVANPGNNSITEIYAGNSQPAMYYTTGNLFTPTAIAIDDSGNVWVVNEGNYSITEFTALAMPVVTPIVAQPR